MRMTWIAGCLAAIGSSVALAEQGVKFDVKLLTVDANEGCTVFDVDGDGKLDVTAGRNWYRNGDWAPRPLRMIEDWNGYVQSNGEHAWDVNGDGRTDVVAGSFLPTEVYWYENPGKTGLAKGQYWKKHLLVNTHQSANEGTESHDLDGDGVPELIVNSWNPKNPMHAWKLAEDEKGRPTAVKKVIGRTHNSHGIGFGDINNDRREDILVGIGWYERPEGDPFASEWPFHADWELGGAGSPILVRDLDGDGRNDIVIGSGHGFGLWWWQAEAPSAEGKLAFKKHLIDESYSQNHALIWADLDGDGQDELLTGKRKWAHNGKDPGGDQPPVLCYYDWDPAAKKFTRHMIDEGRIGTGLQIRTADLNEDDRIDIVVAGKTGTYVLINRGR